MEDELHEEDLRRIAERGLARADVERQLALLRSPQRYTHLVRPCTPGDGIRVLREDEVAAALAAQADAAAAGRFLCFVPASGAATRMFRALLAVREREPEVTRAALEEQARAGDGDARETLTFADGLTRFAFADSLRASLRRHGEDLDALLARGRLGPILEHLLEPVGLDYAALPKGLLEFHRYPEGARTAFEEHLVEAASYARAADGRTTLHFTVSPQHQAGFEARLEAVRAAYEKRLEARFEVAFSQQDPSTDTVAVDLEGRPFRDASGALLFRPGGHGALLGNLERCGADVAYVKNIDNVVPDHRKDVVVHWKRVLGGLLVLLQAKIFAALRRLDGDPGPEAVAAAAALLRDELATPLGDLGAAPLDERRAVVRRLLARPLRVCGMVRCAGDPGGGPFWVRGRDGSVSPQIVETAQVDPRDPEQRRILASPTHFNPVDLVCGLRDHEGRPFELARYVDRYAVFISEKSSGGRKLRALEHPGLWNGGMADWNTLFVEVPPETFNPVKTVNDLLRPEHQPPDA